MRERVGTVYGIKAHQVLISGPDYRYYEKTALPPLRVNDDEFVTALDESIKEISLAWHCIRSTRNADQWIAIEPELREILEAPFSARVAKVEGWLFEEQQRHKSTAALLKAAQGRIAGFLSLPWYRRAWQGLRGLV